MFSRDPGYLVQVERVIGCKRSQWPKFEGVEFTIDDQRDVAAQGLAALRRMGGTKEQFDKLRAIRKEMWSTHDAHVLATRRG